MAGGGDRRRRRQGDGDPSGDESSENSDDEEMEEIEEALERRLEHQQRIRELQTELNRRKSGYESFVRNLNKKWDNIMQPIPCSAASSEDEADEMDDLPLSSSSSDKEESQKPKRRKRKGEKRKVAKSLNTKNLCDAENFNKHIPDVSEVSSDIKETPIASTSKPTTRPTKMYRESTAKIMFRWAQNQDDFVQAKQRCRDARYTGEQTVERKAFFEYFEQINKEHQLKIEKEQKHIKEQWSTEKRRKKDELKGKCKEEFEEWVKKEEQRRLKEETKKIKKDLKKLRAFYLETQEDVKFPLGSEPSLEKNNSLLACEAPILQ